MKSTKKTFLEAYCGQIIVFLSKTVGQKVQGRSERKGVGCAAGSWMLEDTSESDGLGAVGVICRIAGLGSSYSWAPERCRATHTLTQTQTPTDTTAQEVAGGIKGSHQIRCCSPSMEL